MPKQERPSTEERAKTITSEQLAKALRENQLRVTEWISTKGRTRVNVLIKGKPRTLEVV